MLQWYQSIRDFLQGKNMRTRKVIARGEAGLESISLQLETVGKPGRGEVLVKMRAATLNYRDLLCIKGTFAKLTKTPEYVPLSCGCGEVAAIGEGVSRVRVGDRVAPLFAQGWIRGGQENMGHAHLGGSADGVARDFAIFNEEGLSLAPASLSDLEVATLPCAGLTAWNALFTHHPIFPGSMVVLQGTGGVSIAALQFAKAAGATVFMTSSSDAKLARARSLGADYLINYRTTPDWGTEVEAATQGRGVDLVVDVVGATQLEQSITALKAEGAISAIGMLEGQFSWGTKSSVPIVPITVGNREQFEAMGRAIEANGIRPVVDRVFPLENLASAFELMASGQFFGKIGITFDE